MTTVSTDAAVALAGFVDPDADSGEALVMLFGFIRPRRGEPGEAAHSRYVAVLELLESDAQRAAEVRHHVLTLLGSRHLVGFFSSSGILPDTGFFTELGRIVSERLLPDIQDHEELRPVLRQVFHQANDWQWLSALPADLSLRFWRMIARDTTADRATVQAIIEQIQEALLIIAYRLGGIDAAAEFGRLGPGFGAMSARFRGLAGATQRYVDAMRAHHVDAGLPLPDSGEVQVLVDQCTEVIDRARRLSMRQGTSLRLTYLLLRSEQSLKRIESLGWMLDAAASRPAGVVPSDEVTRHWSLFVRQALAAESRRRSVSSHLASGMSMLALRVTDNAAKTGEHYIAETRPEYFAMWRAAMGAGLIIAVMAMIKLLASGLSMPPAGVAVTYSLIYGLGFVVIYMLHLTVATKQPAMTAQTIATYLGELRSTGQRRVADLDRVVDLFAAVIRTQTAAILGNVVVALPVAIGLFALLAWLRGEPPVSVAKADYLLHDLDIRGSALPHAALAGVFLFMSGVINGYFDNQASYSRLAQRVGQLRWPDLLGGSAMAMRLGAYLEAHLGGLLGNFLFGCMLGTAGTFGIIFGLPIDIRHIAFAAANLGYAVAAHDFALPWRVVAWSALGVALIGVVNLTVSFVLALWMALRARGVVVEQPGTILRHLGRRFLASPVSFFTARGLRAAPEISPASPRTS